LGCAAIIVVAYFVCECILAGKAAVWGVLKRAFILITDGRGSIRRVGNDTIDSQRVIILVGVVV